MCISPADHEPTRIPLTPNQVRGFWAAWGGWVLDGMDSFIYALVLVPALRELLPRSGISATTANIGYYGGVLFALFLVGWGTALLWGPVADRFGRVRTLMLTIICFSFFTLLSAFSNNIWTLAVLRLLAGIGIGGEWGIGATLIAEEWPEERRTMGAGMMHTGYYFGFFLAALANYVVGSRYGWRWMFVAGGLPALLVMLIRKGMTSLRAGKPSALSRAKKRRCGGRSRKFFRRDIACARCSISCTSSFPRLACGPALSTCRRRSLFWRRKRGIRRFNRRGSHPMGQAILSIGTILGALSVPGIADRLGRRTNQAIFYSLMCLVIIVTFGYVFYLQTDALQWFFVCLFFLGIGGANYTVYSFWLPEQYETECRASALAFAQNVGRFAGRRGHVSGRDRRAPLSDAGHSRGDDRCSFRRRAVAASLRRGDERQAVAR